MDWDYNKLPHYNLRLSHFNRYSLEAIDFKQLHCFGNYSVEPKMIMWHFQHCQIPAGSDCFPSNITIQIETNCSKFRLISDYNVINLIAFL